MDEDILITPEEESGIGDEAYNIGALDAIEPEVDVDEKGSAEESEETALGGLPSSEGAGGRAPGVTRTPPEVNGGGDNPSGLEVEEGSSYNNDDSSVASQLDKLLDSDSDYMRASQARANEQASALGMMSSSSAVGASQRAAIESALPIAQQDAQTAAKFQQQQQAAENMMKQTEMEGYVSAELKAQEAAITEKQMEIQKQIDSFLSSQGYEQSKGLEQFSQEMGDRIARSQANLQYQLEADLYAQQVTASTAETIRTSAATIMQNYQISVENHFNDPEFLGLDDAARKNLLNQELNVAMASIKFIASSSGVDMSTYLADLYASAKWV